MNDQPRFYEIFARDPVSDEEVPLLRLPSVTSITRMIAKPALVGWSAKLAKEGRDYQKETIAARDRGSMVHDGMHARLASPEEFSVADYDPEVKPYLEAFNEFCYDWGPKHLEAEYVTVSLEHGYAGRIDSRCLIKDTETLVDIKTSGSSQHFDKIPFLEHRLQIVAYAQAEKERGKHVQEMLIVRLGGDGVYAVYSVDREQVCDLFDAFLGAKRLFEVTQKK